MRVPGPIEITEHHGSAPLEQLCREILALTKMDWNSPSPASHHTPLPRQLITDSHSISGRDGLMSERVLMHCRCNTCSGGARNVISK